MSIAVPDCSLSIDGLDRMSGSLLERHPNLLFRMHAEGIEHGLLHLHGMNNWRFMRCGGSCSHWGSVDPGRATNIARRAFQKFLPNVNEHDTSDSAYQQRRPLSISVPPRSATPGKKVYLFH